MRIFFGFSIVNVVVVIYIGRGLLIFYIDGRGVLRFYFFLKDCWYLVFI